MEKIFIKGTQFDASNLAKFFNNSRVKIDLKKLIVKLKLILKI